jgi:hypothetical protein
LLVGVFLSLLGLVLYVSIGGVDGFTALLVVGLNGAVWLVLGVVFIAAARSGVRKMEQLKSEGNSYEVNVTDIIPSASVRMGNMPVVRIEGIYVNRDGQRCKVRSKLFLWKSHNAAGLLAKVHVDGNDPRRYAFELTESVKIENDVDIDYT